MVLILGIETSCDETGIAIVKDGKEVVCEKLKSSVDMQKEFGGVVPELASRVHVEHINLLIKQSLKESGLCMGDIDAVAVANGPGLVGALLVGTMVAKTIGMVEKKKLIGVNHLEGHIASSFLQGKNDDASRKSKVESRKERQIVLIVSGGHTELVLMKDFGEYQIIGSTIDDAAGEAFDKAAKILGLDYPGGPSIARSAMQEARSKKQDAPKAHPPRVGMRKMKEQNTITLPRPMMDSGDYNFSFSGLKTALLYEVQSRKSKVESFSETEVAWFAYEFQEAVVDVLVGKTKKAIEEYEVDKLVVVGGVAANKRLRERLMDEMDVEVNIPEFKYCTDNGVKIAVAGYYKYVKNDLVRWQDLEVRSNWELG